MTTESDKLRQMINEAPDTVDNLNNSIAQIEDIRDEIDEQIDAVEDGLCGVAEQELADYLENTKIPELSTDSTASFRVEYGPTYGTIDYVTGNITDWAVQELQNVVPPPPDPPIPVPTWVDVYVYEGVGWDGDTTVTGYITDYAFGNDYLTRPLTSGASYGLKPYKASLNDGIDLLTENRDKVDNSITVFEDYAS